MLIDQFMPAFDVAERHGIVIRAPADRAYAGIRSVDLTRSFVIRSLFALRGFPAVYAGRGAVGEDSRWTTSCGLGSWCWPRSRASQSCSA